MYTRQDFRKYVFIMFGVLLLSTAVLVVFPPASHSQKPIELTISGMYPPGHFADKQLHRWAKKVEDDSKGRLKFYIYSAGTFIKAFETFDGVAKGVADLGTSYLYGRKGSELNELVSIMIAGLPSSAMATRIVDEARKQFPELDKEWEPVKILWWVADTPAMIVTKPRPVRTLEDLKGLQIRVPIREVAEALKALGGTPIAMSLADLVIGLDKGTVDGASVQRHSIPSYKLAPAGKYCTEFSLYNPPCYFLVMNWNKWKALPPDLQKVMEDSLEWAKRDCVASFDEGDKAGIEWAKNQGMQFITLSQTERNRWLGILESAYGKEAKALDARGYPATRLYSFIRELRDRYVK